MCKVKGHREVLREITVCWSKSTDFTISNISVNTATSTQCVIQQHGLLGH